MNKDDPNNIEETAEDENEVTAESTSETEEIIKIPRLWHNYISLGGGSISAASIVSIVLLFMIELTGSLDQPYLGILIYILLPGVMLFGFAIIGLGMLVERRRRKTLTPEEISAYPILDLNGPRRRRAFIVFLFCTFIFLFLSGFGSYRAYEFTESVTFCGEVCHTVMKPELVAYNASSHARVKCVECHVGGGAEWYLRSKFSGVRQLYGVLTDSYSKPIKTPVHNMRPANDTCAKCHWPDKFYGDQLKVFNHYGFDEKNSLNQTRMLIKVGGGNPETGDASGIHWHMNLANEITYISSDPQRQNVVWVRMKGKDGRFVEYNLPDSPLSAAAVSKASKRKMDCIDCHNRPTHVFLSPTKAVDDSLTARKLDASLPFLKREAVNVLSKEYSTTEEALAGISKDISNFYVVNYPDLHKSRRADINMAIVETQRIYTTYFFPEMKTNWQSHPDNIGHYNAQGCFRCHNGNLRSKEGFTIRTDCSICHTTIDQTFDGKTTAAVNGEYTHPVNLGQLDKVSCTTCHVGDRSFKHPLNLGDISRFSCTECHKSGFDKSTALRLK